MITETEYANSRGDRVATSDASADPVRFYPSGGGFEYSMSHAKFHAEFKPAPEKVWRRGVVDGDWMEGEKPLPCWSDGSLWNGWSMPYFNRPEVEKLIAMFSGEGLARLSWDGDKVFEITDDPEDEGYHYKPVTMPDGSQAWGVGAGSWCWNRIEYDGEPRDDDR
jgi:hypothetical protein